MNLLYLFPEPDPDVEIDEYAAQAVLRRPCPTCHATPGFSCTIPVDVDFKEKRQQVLTFHRDRLPKDMDGFEGTALALDVLTRSRISSGGVS